MKWSLRFRHLHIIWWLMGLNIALWLVSACGDAISYASGDFSGSSPIVSFLGMPSSPTEILHHWWSPITFSFIHPSFIHLAVNMLWLWWFWLQLDIWPEKRRLWLYISGALSGALFFLVASFAWSAPGSILCGASSCVLAVMGATAIALPQRRIHFLFSSDVRLLWVTLCAIAITLFGSGMSLSFWAHLGGLLAGVVFALIAQHYPSFGVNHYKYSFSPKPTREPKRVNPFPSKPDTSPGSGYSKLCEKINADARLDELLDKISMSGYDSLSAAERDELNHLSSILNR